MEILPNNLTCLELTMAIPGFSSSSSSGNISKGCMEELEEDREESPINGSPTRRKKLRLTKRQSLLLEQSFEQNQSLSPKEKEALALHLKLKVRQVEVWFQNRRARSKLKQTEVECEHLKRWFESLQEENMRLHKEAEELKAVKLADPPHGCHPSSTISSLTMCPHCERITMSTTTSRLYKGSTTTSMTASAANLPFLPPQEHYASPYN